LIVALLTLYCGGPGLKSLSTCPGMAAVLALACTVLDGCQSTS
jgi:hypothetical protein